MRKCGDCSACCFVGAVPALNKGAHESCQFECNGCSIFGKEERPKICNNYECGWLGGYGGEHDRPDLSNIMMSLGNFNGGRWVFAIETKEGSLMNEGRSIVLAMANSFNVPVIVVNFGSKPPHDTGDWAVIKDSLKHRARKMVGKEVGRLADNVGVYELIKG